MSEAELDAIEQRANAATPGPWRSVEVDDPYVALMLESGAEGWPAATDADRAFIAAARSDVPALVAEVRRLRSGALAIHRQYCDASATEVPSACDNWLCQQLGAALK